MRYCLDKIIWTYFLLTCTVSIAQKQQNVLMIVLDDLNNYVGIMQGHPQSKTPNIDKLSHSGITFTNAHSNVPICMPSRASFMTGILPTNSGCWGFDPWLKNETLINSKTLPEYFKENGYNTYQSGKVFHNSKKGVWDEMGAFPDYGPLAYNGKKAAIHPSNPKKMGELGPLDATFTSLADIPDVKPTKDSPGYKGWFNTSWKVNAPFHYANDEDRDLMTDEKSAAWLVNRIEQLDNDNSTIPFFIAVGFIRPHTPLVVPQKYFDMFPLKSVQIPIIKENDRSDTKLAENTTKESRGRKAFRTLTESYSSKEEALRIYTQAYLASVAFADDQVGKVLAALEKSSFNDNTTVVLFSDHGYNLGQKDYLFKYSLWEESTHVPLIIKDHRFKENEGKQVEHPVGLVDIYPTLIDLCDLNGSTLINEKGAPIDGHSLRSFLQDPESELWEGPDVVLSIIASWKSKRAKDQHLSIRSRDFRYIRYYNGAEELYDHRTDPHEWNNLSNNLDFSEIKKDLKNKLDDLLK